jgi:hypothetical protein
MAKYVVDERVGCVAVYPSPKKECLSGVATDPECLFYARGMWNDKLGHWTVDPIDVKRAVRICEMANRLESVTEFMSQALNEGDGTYRP